MTISYAINGTSIEAGIQATWEKIPTGPKDSGLPRFATDVNMGRHLWQADEMNITEWLVLEALRGVTLTSVTTTDYDSPNSGKTYTTAYLVTVSGQQQGVQILNVRAEFIIGGL